MGETVNIKDFERQYKRNAFKSRVKNLGNDILQKCKNGVTWIAQHPGEVAVISSGIGIATKVGRKIDKTKTQYNKEHVRYDRSSRLYVNHKTMSNKDWKKFMEFKKQGYTDTQIFEKMGKLK